MKGQELVDGKDRPLWWRMEHSGGLWALVLVDEAYAQGQGFDGIDAPQSWEHDGVNGEAPDGPCSVCGMLLQLRLKRIHPLWTSVKSHPESPI